MGTLLVVCGLMLHQLFTMPYDSRNQRRRLSCELVDELVSPSGNQYEYSLESDWEREGDKEYKLTLWYNSSKNGSVWNLAETSWVEVKGVPPEQVPGRIRKMVKGDLASRVMS